MNGQIDGNKKEERSQKLIKLSNKNQQDYNEKYIGTKHKILVEGFSKNNEEMLTGRTDSNKVVVFEGAEELIGTMVNLEIVSEHMWYLKGKLK